MRANKNPNTLVPSDKWFCDHSCGFEPPDDGESPYACYDCGWEQPESIESQLNQMVVDTIKSETTMRGFGLNFRYCNFRNNL